MSIAGDLAAASALAALDKVRPLIELEEKS